MITRLIKFIFSLLYYILYKIIILIIHALKKEYPCTAEIITYHSVKPENASQFEKHMDILLKLGEPCHAKNIPSLRNRNHYIAVTFDDAYSNITDNAIPILKKRKIPATVFVTTGYLDKKPGWLIGTNNENADDILMSDEQLKKLPEDLITIGSHCVTHPYLANIGKDNVLHEITDSKKYLEQILQREITLLSFPYGSYTNEIIELAREVGYERIFINVPIFTGKKRAKYVSGRVNITFNDWEIEYRLKLLGAYRWLPIAMTIKRFLLRLLKFNSA